LFAFHFCFEFLYFIFQLLNFNLNVRYFLDLLTFKLYNIIRSDLQSFGKLNFLWV
jgi:hypothetical protein